MVISARKPVTGSSSGARKVLKDTHERIRRNKRLLVRKLLVTIPRRPCCSASEAITSRRSSSSRLDPFSNLLLLLRSILVPAPFRHFGRIDIDDQRTFRDQIGRRGGHDGRGRCIGGGRDRSDEFLCPLADLIEVLFVPLVAPDSALPNSIAFPPPLTRVEAPHKGFVIRTSRRRLRHRCGIDQRRVRVAVTEGGEQRIGGAHSRTRVLPSFVPIEVDLCGGRDVKRQVANVSSARSPPTQSDDEFPYPLAKGAIHRLEHLLIPGCPGVEEELRLRRVQSDQADQIGDGSFLRKKVETLAGAVSISSEPEREEIRGFRKLERMRMREDLTKGERLLEMRKQGGDRKACCNCRPLVPGVSSKARREERRGNQVLQRTLGTSFSSSWTWLVSR